MMIEQATTYRNLITLKDGARVLLRLLTPDDRSRLVEMFASASPEDAKYLRDRVTDPKTVERWMDELDYRNVLPLVAIVQDRIVGDATLHFNHGPARHTGEVRIFLTKDFRRRGLGTHMLKAVIDLARKAGLCLLAAQVVADQTRVIKAFRNAGFELQCSFEDYFMFPDGELADLAMLTLRLVPREEEY